MVNASRSGGATAGVEVMGCRDVGEGCPAPCSASVLAAELARQCPGLGDGLYVHRAGGFLCAALGSLWVVPLSQLIALS